MYDDLGLFQCFWFPRCELLEVIDEFNDDLQFLALTKGSLSRWPYAITVVTDSILCIVAAVWQGCHNFRLCT